MLFFRKKYTLESLDEYLKNRQREIKSDLSVRCKILIIDDLLEDDIYPLKEELDLLKNASRYNITAKTDLDNITDAAGYDLIICDNQGIGKKICGSKGNGISLLKLLIAEYPGKRYVMLSNKEIKINRLESFARLSTKISVWDKDNLANNYNTNGEKGLIDHIHDEVTKTLNPLVRWKEIRRSFVTNTNINLHDLAKIEEAYIESIIKNKPQIYDRSIRNITTPEGGTEIPTYLKATKSIIEFTITILSIL